MTTVDIPTLRTERLVLRALRMEDFDAYAATFASPRARYMGRLDRDEAWAAFANDAAGWVLYGFGHWAMDLADGTHVGEVGFQHPPRFPEPEIGWLLHAGHVGRGYTTEAAQAALAWGRERRIPSLVSYITPGNDRSVAVAERLGARLDPDAPLPEGETADETHVYRHWGRPGGAA